MKRKVAGLALLVLSVPLAASAGVVFTAVTKAEGSKGADQQNVTVKGWVDGELGRFDFVASGNPLTPEGTYLLTTDGGKEIYLVHPKQKTYSKFDQDAMVRLAGSAMSVINMKVSDLKIEKLGQAADGLVAGLPTIRYEFRTTYTTSMNFMGFKKSSRIVKEEEVWAAPKLVDLAVGVWLRKEPPKFGDESLDKLVQAEMDKVEGFPLKRKIVQTETDEKGKATVTTILTEVTSLELTSVPANLFEIPADYKETALLPGMEGGQGEDNPFLRLRGGKKK